MTNEIRAQFPFLQGTSPVMYLDNAATTQKPRVVIDTVSSFYSEGYGNISRGSHQFTRKTTAQYEHAREILAQFIHATSSREIMFTSGSTESVNLIAACLLEKERAQQNKHTPRVIITTKIEHNSNLLPWQQLEDSGLFRLMYTPLKADLTVDIQGLTEITSKHPIAIVAISHVSNVTGTIQPIRTISETVKRLHPEAVIITDASQSIGHMSINVEQLRTDVLFFSGHKMYGPTGSGVIYVKETVLADLAPYHVGGGMAKTVTDHDYEPKRYPSRFEAGTPNIEGALGLCAACEWLDNLDRSKVLEHEVMLANNLRAQLEALTVKGLAILGDKAADHSGILSFYIKGLGSEDIANFLDDDGICVRSGHHCTQLAHSTLFGIDSSVRVSYGVYNTEDDNNRLVQSLTKAVALLSD